MIQWAIIFFIIAIVASIFGFSGIAQDTAYIARILAVIGIVLFIITLLFGRRRRR